jgi:hypothetical protein
MNISYRKADAFVRIAACGEISFSGFALIADEGVRVPT